MVPDSFSTNVTKVLLMRMQCEFVCEIFTVLWDLSGHGSKLPASAHSVLSGHGNIAPGNRTLLQPSSN